MRDVSQNHSGGIHESTDPFASIVGAGQGSQRDSAERDAFGSAEPSAEECAARGTAVLSHYASYYTGHQLRANDEDADWLASDIITNVLHAIARQFGEGQAFDVAGCALADLLRERREGEDSPESSLDPDILGEQLDELAARVRRRAEL